MYIVGVTCSSMCFTISAIHIEKTGVNCITPILFYLKFNLVFFFFTFFIKRSKESGTTASKQQNSETTTKLTNDRGESKEVKIIENNQTQKDGS